MKINGLKKTIFLTGANGFLGSHITRELLLRNYAVTAFIENGKEPYTLLGLSDVNFIYGDILNKEEIQRATKGCNYIIHTAANTTLIPARSKKIKDINIIGTQNIINAALKNKVSRLIHVGSANTFGYGSIQNPGNETLPYNCSKFKSDYMDSKREAHNHVLHAVKTQNLPAVILCPTFMFGKYDSKLGPGAMIVSVHSQKLPGYPKGGRNYIYVADVAVAVVNAIELGKVGEAYILGNQNLNYKSAFSLIARTIGVKAPTVMLPEFFVLTYGLLCMTINKITKKIMPINFAMARIANEEFYYDSSKARNSLLLPQTSIDIAIKECYNWLKEEKLLSKK